MSGLDALREAKKRSPETLTILLTGNDMDDGLEAQVGEEELFQVVRGALTPDRLIQIIEEATRGVRLAALSISANDKSADFDSSGDELSLAETGTSLAVQTGRHPVPEDNERSSQVEALTPRKAADTRGQPIDVLVLTQDEEFLKTVRESSEKTHAIHHASLPGEAEKLMGKHPVGVLVTDAALASENIEALTKRLRQRQPRLVAVVAGRREEGETLMSLINRGVVYRFLLKPVSPGRARLAIEASARYHVDAPDRAFKGRTGAPSPNTKAKAATPIAKNTERGKVLPPEKSTKKPAALPEKPAKAAPTEKRVPDTPTESRSPLGLDGAMDQGKSFTETVTDLAATVAKSLAKGAGSYLPGNGANQKIVIPPEGSVPVKEFPYDDSPDEPEPPNYKMFAGIAFAVLLAIAGGLYFMLGSEEDNPGVVAETTQEAEEAPTERIMGTETMILVTQARTARTNGNLYSPAGRNAVEFYIQAREAEPDNPEIQAEFAAIIDEVFASAESSLLEGRTIQASRALRAIELADPDNNRLEFMDTQLRELELRNALDDVRAAIAQDRFEDAGRLLRSAEDYVVGVSPELEALSLELAAARSDQQLDEVLVLAGARLANNQLIAPSSDNARYFFELALAVEPDNTAATQGLLAVANKLALRARAAIDNGDLAAAEEATIAAQALDPDSQEVRAALEALERSRNAVPEAPQPAPGNNSRPREAAMNAVAPAAAARNTAAAVPVTAAVVPETVAASSETAPTAPKPVADAPARIPPSARQQEAAPIAASTAGPPAPTGAPDQTSGASPETVAISALNRTKYVPPSYPRAAQRRNLSGFVDVAFTVDEAGKVADIEIREYEPSDVFNEAAIEAIEQWEFEPATDDGVAAPKRVAVRMSFNLQ